MESWRAGERSYDPVALVGLAGAGMMLGHQLGYLAASGSGAGHEYFRTVGPILLLASFATVWSTALSIVRRGVGRLPPLGLLVTIQVLLFAVVETAERAIGSAPGSLWSMPVVLGLVAQPLVAVVARWILTAGERALLRALKGAPRLPLVLECRTRSIPSLLSSSEPVSVVRLRGPPPGAVI